MLASRLYSATLYNLFQNKSYCIEVTNEIYLKKTNKYKCCRKIIDYEMCIIRFSQFQPQEYDENHLDAYQMVP
jgi:hypothetical protein